MLRDGPNPPLQVQLDRRDCQPLGPSGDISNTRCDDWRAGQHHVPPAPPPYTPQDPHAIRGRQPLSKIPVSNRNRGYTYNPVNRGNAFHPSVISSTVPTQRRRAGSVPQQPIPAPGVWMSPSQRSRNPENGTSHRERPMQGNAAERRLEVNRPAEQALNAPALTTTAGNHAGPSQRNDGSHQQGLQVTRGETRYEIRPANPRVNTATATTSAHANGGSSTQRKDSGTASRTSTQHRSGDPRSSQETTLLGSRSSSEPSAVNDIVEDPDAEDPDNHVMDDLGAWGDWTPIAADIRLITSATSSTETLVGENPVSRGRDEFVRDPVAEVNEFQRHIQEPAQSPERQTVPESPLLPVFRSGPERNDTEIRIGDPNVQRQSCGASFHGFGGVMETLENNPKTNTIYCGTGKRPKQPTLPEPAQRYSIFPPRISLGRKSLPSAGFLSRTNGSGQTESTPTDPTVTALPNVSAIAIHPHNSIRPRSSIYSTEISRFPNQHPVIRFRPSSEPTQSRSLLGVMGMHESSASRFVGVTKKNGYSKLSENARGKFPVGAETEADRVKRSRWESMFNKGKGVMKSVFARDLDDTKSDPGPDSNSYKSQEEQERERTNGETGRGKGTQNQELQTTPQGLGITINGHGMGNRYRQVTPTTHENLQNLTTGQPVRRAYPVLGRWDWEESTALMPNFPVGDPRLSRSTQNSSTRATMDDDDGYVDTDDELSEGESGPSCWQGRSRRKKRAACGFR